MKCQYTGKELTSKRAKNAPEVTALLDAANRKKVYSQVIEALVAARDAGLTGDDVLQAGQIALERGLAAATEWRAEQRAYDAQRKAELAERVREYQAGGPRVNPYTEDTREEMRQDANFRQIDHGEHYDSE